MSEKKQTPVKARYALPFFAALAVLTVVAFILPLRPTRSQTEKRALTQFPTYSQDALLEGSWFDSITTWFSDTFPGREQWLLLSSRVDELHGYSAVAIEGELGGEGQSETVPTAPTAPVTLPTYVPDPTEESREQVIIETVPPPSEDEESWGGIDAGEDQNIIYGNSMIQIGDSTFGFCAFSQQGCDRHINVLNTAAAVLADKDVRVISLPIPTSVGIMVEKQYQQKLHCAPQDEIIDYLFAGMHSSVVKVDLYDTLVAHNDEYIYFRTDHHWTARGAYYAYEALCKELGFTATPLESFREWDMGVFEGSGYSSAPYPRKLTKDNLYAYVPTGEVSMLICPDGRSGYAWDLIKDKSHRAANTKYMAFLSGDHALCIVTNDSIPDGPSCVIFKDSFGNPFVPFLTENYHKVYVIDYRKYKTMGLRDFVTQYDIDDVIFAHNLNGAQAIGTSDLLDALVR